MRNALEVALVASLVIWTSCSRREPKPAARALSLDDARTALVEMVESSDDEILRMSLDFLRTAPAEEQGAGVVAIGAWKVNLDEHRFSVAADSTIGFQEWTGEFRLRDKRWQAVITGGRHT